MNPYQKKIDAAMNRSMPISPHATHTPSMTMGEIIAERDRLKAVNAELVEGIKMVLEAWVKAISMEAKDS